MNFYHDGNITGFSNRDIKASELKKEILDKFKHQLQNAKSVSFEVILNSKYNQDFSLFINQLKSKLSKKIDFTLTSKIDDNIKDIKVSMIIIYDRFDFKNTKTIKDTFDTTITYKSDKMVVDISTLNEPKIVVAQASVENIDEMNLWYNDEFFNDLNELYKLDVNKIKDDIMTYVVNLMLENYYKPLVSKNSITFYSSENIALHEKVTLIQEKLICLKKA